MIARTRRSQAGFTLLEILVALAVFVVAVSSVMSLLLVAASSHKKAVDNTRVGMLAESVLADLEAQLKLGKGLLRKTENAVHPDHPGLKYDVFADAIDDVLVEVRIVVKWRREGVDREHAFETVLIGQVRVR